MKFNEAKMKNVGVEIIDPDKVALKCMTCGRQWSPLLQSGGDLPRGYWKCPDGCNATDMMPKE